MKEKAKQYIDKQKSPQKIIGSLNYKNL